ncbi:hypothetical protein AWL63_06200 [Sphingomonas panacis]|uniref:Uncharacterized protein n=1 Tax=Sphingomonas panacis TaxID=1560345 RepID=A0A1B3Z872_9SPHN|nr:hypothetical protein [Sphingomonas panacis]AOH83623.1 hypothetical protein AWL63_06200 [Sphingomonas panacis]
MSTTTELPYSAVTGDPTKPLVDPSQPLAANAGQISETDAAKIMTAIERLLVSMLQRTSPESGWALPITDAANKVMGGVRPDGTFEPFKFKAPPLSILATMLAGDVSGRLLSAAPIASMFQLLSEEQGGGLAILDQVGKMSARLDLTGLLKLFKAQLGVGSTVADLPGVPLPDRLLPGGLAGQLRALPPETGWAFAITDLATPPHILFGVPLASAVVGRVAVADTAKYAIRAGNQAISLYGDSMTYGQGASAGQDIGSIIRNLSGRTVKNRAIAGQRSGQIIARQGGDPALVTVAGNMIPASGSVTVNLLSEAFVPNYDGNTVPRTIPATLAGIPGAIIRDDPASSGPIRFQRTTPGIAMACPAASPIYVQTAGDDQQDTQIIWVGRNDVSQGYDLMTVVAPKVENAVRFLGHGRFLIIGVCNLMDGTEDTGSTDNAGLARYNSIVAYNNYMAGRWGGKFFDVRRYMIDRAITDMGSTPTSDDLADIAVDRIPLRFSVTENSKTHFNADGYALVGAKFFSLLNAKGL